MADLQKCPSCGSPIEVDRGDSSRCLKCGAFVATDSLAWNPYEAPTAGLSDAAGLGLPLEVPPSVMGKFVLAFRLLGENLGLFALITLTVGLPANIVVEQFAINGQAGQELDTVRIGQILQGLFGPISVGALVYAIARRLDGERVGYAEAMGVGFRNWGRLFAANFFAGLFILLGCIALLVPGIILMVRYSLLAPVVILERAARPRERSTNLAKGRGWSIVGAAVLFYCLYGIGFYSVVFGLEYVQQIVQGLEGIWINVGIQCLFDILEVAMTIVIVLFYGEARQHESVSKPLAEEFDFKGGLSEEL